LAEQKIEWSQSWPGTVLY